MDTAVWNSVQEGPVFDLPEPCSQAAITLRPGWAKAHGRRGAALCGLGDAAGAEAAYEEGLALEPGSEALVEGLRSVREGRQ